VVSAANPRSNPANYRESIFVVFSRDCFVSARNDFSIRCPIVYFLVVRYTCLLMVSETILHEQFHHILQNSKRTLLVSHKKPDGDTLGGATSVLNYLLREGKAVRAFCVDPIPEQFSYLPSVAHFSNDPAVFTEDFDVLCMFDASSLDYAGVTQLIATMPRRPTIVNVDHHATNTRFGDLNVLFTDASSTAEVVFRFYETNRTFIDPSMATCLLTGIITDTSNFVNPATNAVCMRAASNLLVCGARLNDITSFLMRNKTVHGLQTWGRALECIKENNELGIASTVVREKELIAFGADLGDAVEGLSNFLTAVLTVPIVMVLYEKMDGTVKGSLRSAGKDVSVIAKTYGGGGHKKASGFTVTGTVAEENGLWQVAGRPIEKATIVDII